MSFLTMISNKILSTEIFLDGAKIVSVSPIDNCTDKKNLDFTPVSVFNAFSKIYKLVFSDQITNVLESVLFLYYSKQTII